MNSPYKNAALRLVEIQGLQLFSSMHWAMACVLAGQWAAQQITVHLSFLINAVDTKPPVTTDFVRLTGESHVSESHSPLSWTNRDMKSLGSIWTFAHKKTTWHFDLSLVRFSMSCLSSVSAYGRYILDWNTRLKFWWHGVRVSEISSNILKTKHENSKPTDTTIVNHSVWNYWLLRVVGCCNSFQRAQHL